MVLGFVWVFGDFLFRCLVSWVLGLGFELLDGGGGGGGGGWCFGILYGGSRWFGFWVWVWVLVLGGFGLGLN